MPAKTSTITWNEYPAVKPTVIYPVGAVKSTDYYFAEFDMNQVSCLAWYTDKTKNIARWQWPDGSVFHGVVKLWASQPIAPGN